MKALAARPRNARAHYGLALALKAKDHRAKSVLFRSSSEFSPGAPDFDYMHEVVQKALVARAKRHHHAQSPAEDDTDACAYNAGQAY